MSPSTHSTTSPQLGYACSTAITCLFPYALSCQDRACAVLQEHEIKFELRSTGVSFLRSVKCKCSGRLSQRCWCVTQPSLLVRGCLVNMALLFRLSPSLPFLTAMLYYRPIHFSYRFLYSWSQHSRQVQLDSVGAVEHWC